MHPWRFSALFLMLVPLGCGADQPQRRPAAERPDGAGGRVIWIRGPDVPLNWRFVKETSIGGAEAGPASFYRLKREYVAADADRRLFVLDAANHRVIVFDSAGNHLRTLGSRGGGPGELEVPFALAVDAEGAANVLDVAKGAFVRFAADGSVLASRRITAGYKGGPVAIADSALVMGTFEQEPGSDRRIERLVVLRGEDTVALASIEVMTHAARFPTCNAGARMPRIFEAALLWDVRGDRVAVTAGTDYVVDIYEGERRQLSIRREVGERPASERLALQEMRDGLSIGGCKVPAEEVVRARGVAPIVPAVRAISLSPDGGIWIQRNAVKGGPSPIDVVAGDGHYVGTLPAGTPFPVVFLSDRRFVAIERDTLDIDRLSIYRTGPRR